jgi:hypothetical protein
VLVLVLVLVTSNQAISKKVPTALLKMFF